MKNSGKVLHAAYLVMQILVLISRFVLEMFYWSEQLLADDSSFLRTKTCLLFLRPFKELVPEYAMVNICVTMWAAGREMNFNELSVNFDVLVNEQAGEIPVGNPPAGAAADRREE